MSFVRLLEGLTGSGWALPEDRACRFLPWLTGLTILLGASGAVVAEDPGKSAPALQWLNHGSIYFETNRGQADSHYQFLARGPAHTIFLGPSEAVLSLHSVSWTSEERRLRRRALTDSALVRVTLPGSSASELLALDPLSGRVNYFIGNDPTDWQTAIPTYGRVECRGVYPGIDLIYHGANEQLEYDFIVAPGAKPEMIALHFEGADNLTIDAGGDLVLTVGPAALRQHRPVAYQTVGGKRRSVAASFRLRDAQTVTFQLGAYDVGHPLVIDPVLSYSTYFGGGPNDQGWAVAVDGAGAAYVAGTTFSTRLKTPPTPGAFQTNFAGRGRVNGDAFVAKLNPAGTAYEYVTYLGGRYDDAAFGIALDAQGNAYVTGYTDSAAMYRATNEVCETVCTNLVCGPTECRKTVTKVGSLVPITITTNVTVMTNRTETNIIVKVTETRLIGATLISAGFPVVNAFQPLNGGTNDPSVNLPFTDAFVSKLDPTGSTLVYSTYLGGDGAEAGFGIAVDAAGRAHVAGYTDSGLVYRTTNEVCTTVCTNRICGPTKCVTNVTFAGSPFPSLILTNVERITNGMTVDLVETVIETRPISAIQVSVGFPVANAIQPNNSGIVSFTSNGKPNYSASSDAFVTTFSADGSSLVYSTYLGGFGDDLASGIVVDALGNATVCGWTRSSDFPVAPLLGVFQDALFGVQDAFVTKFDSSGTSLIYSTYLGGTGGALANRIAADAAGNAYIVGSKTGNGFPSTPGALNRGGVFRSADAGASWTFSGDGLDHPLVQALAVAPTLPQPTIYAGTQRGIFRSLDGGASWFRSSGNLSNLVVNAIVVDPTTASRLYAGTADAIYASLDGGLIWINRSGGLTFDNVKAIAIAKRDPAVLYLGSQRGVFKSTDASDSWVETSSGLGNRQINALAIDPLSPSTLYAATQGGVFKSTNAAEQWRSAKVGLSATLVKALVLDRDDPNILYAGTTRGFFRSTNAADNWSQFTNGLGRPFITSLALHPLIPATLYAGTTNGIFASADAGQTWVVVTNGLSPRNVASLAIDGLTVPATLYAGMFGTNSFGGTNDVFLTKLRPDGFSLEYSVVFGGKKNEQGWDVAVDDAGQASVVGATTSLDFPVFNVPGTNQFRLSGKSDAFVAQLNPDASAYVYSFYLGGRANDYGYGVAVDSSANVYVTGATFAKDFPVTNAVQSRLAGGSDAFLSRILNPPALGRPLPAQDK